MIIQTEDTKKRWIEAGPDNKLTWYLDLKFNIKDVLKHVPNMQHLSILEIGPGYGRFLKSLPFVPHRYTGIDISIKNIQHLKELFPQQDFIHGDVEETHLPRQFDLCVAFLVFKHLYPTFEKAVTNIKCSTLIFDFLEEEFLGGQQEEDGTWLRGYTENEVKEIMERNGFDVKFDKIVHVSPEEAEKRNTGLGISRSLCIATRNA